MNNLSFLGRKTVLRPKIVQLRKKFFDQSCLDQLLSEKSDGLSIRHRIVKTQTEKTQNRNAILDLKLQLIVREVVSEIKTHDLEHESNIKRLPFCIGLWLFVSNHLKSLAKLLPVDYLVQFNQRVAAVVKLFQTSLPIKKSCWHHNQSFDGELNHPNLIVNELILTNMQKIAPI